MKAIELASKWNSFSAIDKSLHGTAYATYMAAAIADLYVENAALRAQINHMQSPDYLAGRWELAEKEIQDDGSVVIGERDALRAQLAQGEPVATVKMRVISWNVVTGEPTLLEPELVDYDEDLIEDGMKLYTAPQQAPVDERAAFERDLLIRNLITTSLLVEIRGKNNYCDLIIQQRWESWQSRAALNPAVPIHSTEECPSPECETCPERSPCSLEEQKYSLKPAVPEGYQLVPIEATDDEIKAGIEAYNRCIMDMLPTITTVEEIRTAMLAAAKG